MKATGHPKYYQSEVVCACGNTFTTGSTKLKIEVEICAKCHPFFTGEMRFVDAMGRVERFQQKQAVIGSVTAGSKKKRKIQKQLEQEAAEAAKPKTLKEMFDRVKAQG